MQVCQASVLSLPGSSGISDGKPSHLSQHLIINQEKTRRYKDRLYSLYSLYLERETELDAPKGNRNPSSRNVPLYERDTLGSAHDNGPGDLVMPSELLAVKHDPEKPQPGSYE